MRAFVSMIRRALTAAAVTVLLVEVGAAHAAVLRRGPYLQVGTPNSVIVRWRTDVATDSRVLFGLDPVTGDRRHLIVEAVAGTPDGLVSGTVTAAHVVLGRNGRAVGGHRDRPLELVDRDADRRHHVRQREHDDVGVDRGERDGGGAEAEQQAGPPVQDRAHQGAVISFSTSYSCTSIT